jgi:N-acetylmuramoyl-L-alanine amidase
MVELGNMKNSGDAELMTTSTGRARYADGLVAGIRRFPRQIRARSARIFGRP